MAFYVPLGPRGILFRLGTVLIGIVGGLVYCASAVVRPSAVPPAVHRSPLISLPGAIDIATHRRCSLPAGASRSRSQVPT